MRNFSMNQYWLSKAADWQPKLAFTGSTSEQWAAWRAAALPKLLELLGDFPDKIDMEPEVEMSIADGELIRERVVFNSEANMSVPCVVLRPRHMKPDRSGAAIVCSHGHGIFSQLSGKNPVAGVRSSPELIQEIEIYNYNYAEQMAKAGYLTISPDLRGFGERRDGENPFPGRDTCDVNFIKGSILGLYTLTLNIWDMKCCVDYLEARPEVDPGRIGMMGLSGGGTMTTFTSAVEPRIKAANIMGYVNSWGRFGIERANFCGMQVVPEIYRYFDTDDIAGLIAPRPLLIDMGIYDECFYIQDLMKGYEGVQRIYKAAGAQDVLDADVHPDGHSFGGNKAFAFFKKYL